MDNFNAMGGRNLRGGSREDRGRLLKRAILSIFLTATGLLGLTSPTALAAEEWANVSSFGSEILSHPLGLAVDQASGDVFVANVNTVQRFAPVSRTSPSVGFSNDTEGQITASFSFAFGVGIDNSCYLQRLSVVECASFETSTDPSNGEVYVVDSGTGEADKFIGPGRPQEGTVGHPEKLETIPPPKDLLAEPVDVAIDPSDGNVYVTDSQHNVLDVYGPGPSGQFLAQVPIKENEELKGLAFDSSGNDLYIVVGGNVDEFGPAGLFVRTIETSGSATAVAVDPATNDLYIAHAGGSITIYEETPIGPISLPGFETGISRPFGLAVDGITHAVYVSDFEGGVVRAYQLATFPETTTGPATPQTESTVKLTGQVNPDGIPVTACLFEYGTTTSYGKVAPCVPAQPGSGMSTVEVHADVEGLEPHTTYHYRLVASNESGTNNKALDETFTMPSKPIIGEESFADVGAYTVTVSVPINPAGSPTTFYVEYGDSEVYGQKTLAAHIGEGQSTATVSVQITELEAGMTYHFRAVATNSYGVMYGSDDIFATVPPATSSLPDGRLYEMVTPPDNYDADTYVPEAKGLEHAFEEGIGTTLPFQSSPEGDAVAYVGDPTIGGSASRGHGNGNQYVATRSVGGRWEQHDLDPLGHTVTYQGFSNDLSTGVLDACDSTPLAADAPGEEYDVLYSHAVGAPTSYQPLFTFNSPPNKSSNEFGGWATGVTDVSGCYLGREDRDGVAYAGASADFGHILFEANEALTPEAGSEIPSEAQNDLYDWDNGQLHLVNISPEGMPLPGAVFGSPRETSDREDPPDFSNVISANGSRIFWTDLANNNLYLRENDTKTTLISEDARFWTANGEGTEVFFTKEGDLYLYNVDSTVAKDLTPDGGVRGVLGTSEDGSYLYFVSTNILAPHAITGTPNLYLYHEGSVIFVAALSPEDESNVGEFAAGTFGDWAVNLGHRTAEVTPNGHSLVFMSRASLTGYRNGGLSEVYVYETESGRLLCVSCNPTGEETEPLTNGRIMAAFLPVSYENTHQRRWISDDGSRVFFDSRDSLVPQDINHKQDVYEWERDGSGSCRQDDGCIYLLSGGTSTSASWLLDASANGDDVFIATRAQLTPQDRNDNYDVYDVRVGVPPPTSLTCEGSGCQGIPPAPPIFATPASVTFGGVGNFEPAMVTKPPSKTVNRGRRLAKALKACRAKRDGRNKRVLCEGQARRRYDSKSKGTKLKKDKR